MFDRLSKKKNAGAQPRQSISSAPMTAIASPAAATGLAPASPPTPAGVAATTCPAPIASALMLRSTLHGDARVPFVPADPASRRVTWYVCGPTVYDVAHMVS